MSDKELLSKTITFLRFPLIVAVVLIHSKFTNVVMDGVKQVEITNYPVFSSVIYLVSETFARTAVPLFFFFSGFLFFYKSIGGGEFNYSIYLSKLKKRARTLLVPYVFWNLLMLAFILLCQIVMPDIMSGRKKLIMDYSVSDWLWNFWDVEKVNHTGTEAGTPVNFPFWFIRDLMVVVLFSPLVYSMVRWLKHYAIILLGVAWILKLNLGISGFSIDALFFFTLGAYFSIHGKNFITILRPFMVPVSAIYFLLVALDLFFRDALWAKDIHLHSLNILLGMIVIITASSYFIDRGMWKINLFLSEGSFFVYAYHAMPQIFINKLAFILVHPHSGLALMILYVVCPTLTVLLGLALYWGMKSTVPRFTAVITGGR